MKLSDAGLELIKHFEGLRLHVYKDGAGLETIGYGHLLTSMDKTSGRFTAGLTEPQALELLRRDAEGAEAAVNACVHVPITQAQFDALVSFTFNLGAAALGQSQLLRKLNSGHPEQVPAEFVKWNKLRSPKTGQLEASPGLTMRREREAKRWSE